MKTSRILAVPALAASALLALTGCIQLPPVGGGTGGGTEQTQAADGGSVDSELAGTNWTGTDAADNSLDLVLEEDGTVLLNELNGNGPFDDDSDTWSLQGDEITIFIGGLGGDVESIEYTGTVGDGTMELSGVDGSGQPGYEITLTQQG
ncbi:hypothetical protein [Agrococcus sp. DT81.2]|uniref:hypothetical protein n=1 Tax=Agrococcus sp. DT81.2 TaxID=3393414 RepID=UPI003CE4D9B1